jgi:hypothetical protein
MVTKKEIEILANQRKMSREWKSRNKKYIKDYFKNYYEKNKAAWEEKYNEPVMCACCGRTYKKLTWSKHIKSAKHERNNKIKELEERH